MSSIPTNDTPCLFLSLSRAHAKHTCKWIFMRLIRCVSQFECACVCSLLLSLSLGVSIFRIIFDCSPSVVFWFYERDPYFIVNHIIRCEYKCAKPHSLSPIRFLSLSFSSSNIWAWIGWSASYERARPISLLSLNYGFVSLLSMFYSICSYFRFHLTVV